MNYQAPPMMSFKYPGMAAPGPVPQELYVGDLDEQMTEEILMSHFKQFGHIYSIKIMRHAKTHKSRGFGFISFYEKKSAEEAVRRANHTKILDNDIRVYWKKDSSYIFKIRKENTNIFFPDIPKDLSMEDVDNVFARFGKILSSKLMEKDSRRIAYLQYEKTEKDDKNSFEAFMSTLKKDAKNYSLWETEVAGKENLGVQKFVFTIIRKGASNNLYLKGIPRTESNEQRKQEIEKIIMDEFSKNDRKISSLLIKECDKGYFAFICFDKPEDAESAKTEFHENTSLFNKELYVDFAQKKRERERLLKDVYSRTRNETNLFTKNLLRTVTSEQLQTAFAVYGEITSCVVREPTHPEIPTSFAFINFKNKEDAKKAMEESRSNESIQSLYSGQIFLEYHSRKEDRLRRRDNTMRQRMMPGPMYNPYMMPMGMEQGYGMPPPPFMNRYNSYPQQPMMMRPGGGAPYQQKPRRPFNGPNPRYQNQNGPKPNGYPSTRPNYNKPYDGQKKYDTQRGAPAIQKTETVPVSVSAEPKLTPASLKERLNDFLALGEDKQREILGNLLFPLIKNHTTEDMAPKVTGMLIDFTVFEVSDILEFLENEETLKERISEAVELITSQGN